MLKPKRPNTRQYWDTLSDDELLSAELTTDNPENLPGLVPKVPEGDEEPYVEYKYDLRGSGQEHEFVCVHCHQPHLAGYVMRSGDTRFMVGWICGKKIYGEEFERYTTDYDAAVNRRDILRRKREIENATKPFLAWLSQIAGSDVFNHYASVCEQIDEHLPWIYDNLPRAASIDPRVTRVQFPRTLFQERTDPEEEFGRIVTEFSAATMTLMSTAEGQERNVEALKRRMELLLRRIEVVLDQLKEIEDFFQPTVLSTMCDLANQYDNPKKRKYEPGLMRVTCKRDKTLVTVQMPKNFRVPDRAAIQNFRSALNGFGT
jgi:hypothetical protein